ncbi:cation-translocating P-type ATPase [Tissierella pigra]|jgi:Ca2+-transporting ATPase|uniref:Cation-translocating P-type ATPase n=1 Tax=Clostridium faecium TaxID=2762223 RepID=A0ABR8YTX2_9CLOT|nr:MULTISPECIES: cation-translocating P-type ATPase [Bacillota]MBV1820377.1 cation-translocating P-type ATPase [Bacteroidales bacterium MSK.15.36]TJX64389.1 cation-translocating P-type ATPase [Soehngenia saccharolytica]HOV27842.1 cation-translocating P-type ATPase [Pseudobacteroides sp.]MBD8047644.1 cation-translocating P-type ATPase [Clostridium faecium]MBU5426206.1 cation-translocating P-type ATPase [Tissierella pigra]
MTEQKNQNLEGLTSEQAKKLQEQFGKNELATVKKQSFISKVIHIVLEPMFLLLIVASIIYFILGEPRDGVIMLIFVIGIISIEIIQEWKTDKTLNALKDLSAPHVIVIRDGKEQTILSEDLVPTDLMIINEGVKIPADGEVIKASDLCVDESSLTGESVGVWKVTVDNADKNNTDYWRKDYCYAGTLVTQGSATILVDKIGSNTEYGKIGINVASAPDSPTPLEKQTNSIVKTCAIIAGILFILVTVITYFNIPDHKFTDRIIESILSGITLAMAMIPEEFPVILTVFLSMGAWRLAKKQSLVHKLSSVETLGAVSVLCVDKTGTITMNKMAVQDTWAIDDDNYNLCEIMGLGCETDAYDPMEKAMLLHCESIGISKDHLFGGELISEYAFTNELKMMGHVWRHDGEIVIAAKGSPESILTICKLSDEQRKQIENKINEMSREGLRVIAVGTMNPKSESDIPDNITDCKLTFLGLIGLADPPRESVKEDIKMCNKAGVRVVMITGDNGITASSIAKQIGMKNSDNIITGDELNNMTDSELMERVHDANIFSRVLPEHKMRIVKAFKENGEVVAMTGDGVNDAPALKYADIGIAMGKRGSEVAREAADLILMDDNFSTIVHTIEDGRRIYDNIKKAIGYVFTIHIPIAFASLFAPLLNISPASLLLLPVHVVLLELIIDPTCSIVLERQPAESNIMDRKPRDPNEKILTAGVLTKSILQGLAIFIASFGTYYMLIKQQPENPQLARTMGLSIIMIANLFLVQVNSSNYDNAFKTMKYLIKDKVMWAVIIGTVAGLLLMLYTPLNRILNLAPLSLSQFFIAVGIAAVSVLWYEIVKIFNNMNLNKNS